MVACFARSLRRLDAWRWKLHGRGAAAGQEAKPGMKPWRSGLDGPHGVMISAFPLS